MRTKVRWLGFRALQELHAAHAEGGEGLKDAGEDEGAGDGQDHMDWGWGEERGDGGRGWENELRGGRER